jgi:hypothetical protein
MVYCRLTSGPAADKQCAAKGLPISVRIPSRAWTVAIEAKSDYRLSNCADE